MTGPRHEDRLRALSPSGRRWLADALTAKAPRTGRERLIGYVVVDEEKPLDRADMVEHLAKRLPKAARPSELRRVERMPRLPNGKVDRSKLSAVAGTTVGAEAPLEPDAPASSIQFSNDVEQRLASIIADVLGVPTVERDDHFFELGGDSILSIQVVAKANQQSIAVTPSMLFERPTVAGLAAALGHDVAPPSEDAAPPPSPSTSPFVGALPLLPIQHWFFDQRLPDRHHWNQALLVELRGRVTDEALRSALAALVDRHDVLRHGYPHGAAGWQQLCLADVPDVPLTHHDATGRVTEVCDALQASLSLTQPPLVRAARLRDGDRSLLFLVLHHLVTDGVSWGILVGDLERALSGRRLSPRTTSYATWAETLTEWAITGRFADQLATWTAPERAAARPLPVDEPHGNGDVSTARNVRVALTAEQTNALLRDAPKRYRSRINEVLLTAVGLAVERWTGRRELLIDVEGHGREALGANIDLSSTVGWFTSLFPVVLRWGGGQHDALGAIKQTLRAIPDHGLGYGVLRYLSPDSEVRQRLAAMPQANIYFNYLGQTDGMWRGSDWFSPAGDDVGRCNGPRGHRSHAIEINAAVRGGALVADFTFSESSHRLATIAGLADAFVEHLGRLVADASTQTAAYVPADFPLAGLSEAELDMLVQEHGGSDGTAIEDIYPLTPVQEGMLFHGLSAPAADLYVVQQRIAIDGPLDVVAFRHAWAQVVARHPALRTELAWESLRRPLQLVRRDVTLPLEEVDLEHLVPERRETAIDEALAEARRPFDLAAAPLSRTTLVRLGPDRHALLWTQHHLLQDGWSGANVLAELFSLYEGRARGAESLLPPARPYRDFVAWLAERDRGAMEAFWRQQLAGFDTPTLLADAALGEGTGHARHEDILGAEDTCALRELARRQGVTLNAVVLTAWALLTSRYTDRTDVVFCIASAGRPHDLDGAERMVGMFINTLPLRLEVDESATVADALAATQSASGRIRAHEHSPLTAIRGWSELGPGRALTDTLFAFESFPSSENDGATTVRHEVVDSAERASFPITVTAEPLERLRLALAHDREALSEPAAVRILAGLARLLRAMARSPTARLASLELLGEDELERVLEHWNETAEDLGPPLCIHRGFERQVRLTPEATALRFGDDRLSFAELNRRANRLARSLRQRGVGRDEIVAVSMDRSFEMMIALVATLKAGGAYLPIDPDYPAARRQAMLQDAEPQVMLDATTFAEIAAESREVREVDLPEGDDPSQLAYVIYTSGSTGQPKGVMIEHAAVHNRLTWMQRTYELGAADRVLQKTPTSFDVSVWELFWPLLTGAELVLAAPGGHKDPGYLAELIEQAQITVMHFVPSMLRAFVDHADLERCGSLRQVVCSGEALPADLQDTFLERLDCHLDNLYGPTEATVDVTRHRCRSGERVPIGRPIANTRCLVLDRRLRPTPLGAIGELHLGGVQLARGYLRRPELTAERFVTDPTHPTERLYKTGDLARYTETGELLFVGRRDHQVKVRGFRIELGEIEAALLDLDEVREAVVVADRRHDRTTLVAYVVAPSRSDERTLQSSLGARLPDYMVPTHWVFLDALPLTHSGKIDRKALPSVERQDTRDGSSRPPTNAVERALVEVWTSVLRVDGLGVDDDFFVLGGDSIVAIQIAGHAKRRGLSFPPNALFAHPTVSSLAEVVVVGTQALAPQGPQSGRLTPTPIQRWFLEKDLVDPGHWNMCLALEATEALSFDRLDRALRTVVAHHDALRLRFDDQGGHHGDVAFDLVALEDAADTNLQRFDLAAGPLLRAAVDGRRLLLVAHHLVVDGVSWSILVDDLTRAYHQQPLPPKTASISDWSRALEGMVPDELVAERVAFWNEQHAPALVVDDDVPRQVHCSEQIVVSIDASTTSQLLERYSRDATLRMDDALLCALVTAVTDWTGNDALAVAVEGHGREPIPGTSVDASRTVGWLTTLHPLRLERASGPLASRLARVAELRRSVLDDGRSYGVLRRQVDVPEPDVLFNYLGRLDAMASTSLFRPLGAAGGHERSPRGRRTHELEVAAVVTGGQLEVIVTFTPGRVPREAIARVADALGQNLRDIAALTPPSSTLGAPHSLPSHIAGDRVEAVMPLTAMQHGMLFESVSSAEGDPSPYLAQHRLDLRGPLDRTALETACRGLVRRHQALRTALCWEEVGQPIQIVLRELAVDFRTAPLPPGDDVEGAVTAYLVAERRRPFDLARPPCSRWLVLELANDHHVLIWTHHLALLDGWSSQMLRVELVELYEAAVEDRPPRLPERVRLSDYLATLGASGHKSRDHWRRQLAGIHHATSFGLAGESHGRALGSTLVERADTVALQRRARELRVTWSTLVSAAWALLLGRYAGTDDVLFGFVDSGRSVDVEGVETVVGNLINTLPARVTLPRDAASGDWLRQLQRDQARAREHGQMHLVDVHGHSDVPRDEPLITSLLVVESYPAGELGRMGDVQIAQGQSHEQTHYPIALFVTPDAELELLFDYDRASFSEADVERLGRHLTRAMQELVADELRPIGEIDFLHEWEKGPAATTRVATTPDWPVVHAVVAAHATSQPQAIAVSSGTVAMTYAGLEASANQLAHHLLERGAERGARIAVGVTRSERLVVALLAVLKTGAAYVPLDPTFPADRLAYMVEDAGVLLTVDDALLSEHADAIEGMPRTAPDVAVSPEDLAYVIYTSGSTGKPKGVAIEHRALANLLESMRLRPGLSASDTLVAVTTVSFDIAALELFLPLVAGGRVVVATEEQTRDGLALATLLDDERATVMQATPATWRLLLEGGWQGRPNLRMLCGGEALPPDLAARLLGVGGQLWNMYGPTETTIWSAVGEVRRDDAFISIGEPVLDTELWILDERRRPVPPGAEGDLFIGGTGLAREYLGRPELTAERFVAHPYRRGERLYATGDRARQRGGRIECLGRRDHQVKLRGYRIELGEIEARLVEHEEIRQAVVVLRDIAGLGPSLVGYYVARHALATEALIGHAEQFLPAYMVPRHFVQLSTLPLTPNRKVDRQALPAPTTRRRGIEIEGARQQLVADVLRELTQASRIFADDKLHDLGGHSLIAMSAAARLHQATGSRVSPRTMLTATVAEIASELDRAVPDGPAISTPSKVHDERMLSHAQQRLWYLEQLTPGTATYNIPAAWRIEGDLDTEALSRALRAVVNRHAPLRTRFVLQGAHPMAVTDDRPPVSVHRVNVTTDDALEAALAEEAARPLDIVRGPVLRATLFRRGPAHHVLSVVVHHIVADGWSIAIVRDELTEAYRRLIMGEPVNETPPEFTYQDYVRWHRHRLTDERLRALTDHWKERLCGDLPNLDLPTDFPRPAVRGGAGGMVRATLPRALTDEAVALGRAHDATLFMVLLGAFTALLARYNGQEDIIVGTPVAARDRPEVEGLIGLFANTVVLRSAVGDAPTFVEHLERTKQVTLDALAHQDLPFEQLVEALAPARDMSITPIFQALFSFQEVGARRRAQGPRATIEPIFPSTTTARTDLSLWVARIDGELECALEYATELFEEATVRRMLDGLGELLRHATADPSCRLPQLTIGQATPPDDADDTFETPATTVVALFEEQSRRTPDACAVESDGGSLSYAALSARANRIAWALIRAGVTAEQVVGICLDRSADLIATVLGVWRAGAAYLPLEPEFPAERLAFMVDDSDMAAVVTSTHTAASLGGYDGPRVLLDELPWSELPATAPDRVPSPAQVAYMIYTSGSTGRPKGVQVEQRQAVNLLTSMVVTPGLTAQDRLLAVTTLSFDISVLELFAPLVVGATVVMASKDDLADAQRIRRRLEGDRISIMQATPATWRMLLTTGWQGAELTALCGGEALPPDLADALADRTTALWNMYGPTETTVWSTCHRHRRGEPVAIGRPIANTTIHVLDRYQQPVPLGVPGELYIGGAGVARGYHRRPALDADRFVTLPGRGRLYRTGDLVRLRPDGVLYFERRVDHQVKLRGFRIELGEIEAVLREHSAITQAVATVREIQPGDRRLVAYYLESDGRGQTPSTLRQHLRTRLPEYMIPQHFVRLETLPLTPNGKIDRNRLPQVFAAPAERRTVAPRNDAERLLCALYAEVLRVDTVDVHDNFFDLGGHSLLSLELIAKLERRTGFRLSPRSVLLDTVAQAAAELPEAVVRDADVEEVARDAGAPPLVATTPSSTFAATPATPLHFGEADTPLFGMHHPAATPRKSRAILVCAPLGQEYMRTHRALARLARDAAACGFDVLRFDYHATGDSSGSGEDATLARWLEDVQTAARELRDLSGTSRVIGVGMRLGASLAAAAHRLNPVFDSLVFWDPVVSGTAYLKGLDAMHREAYLSEHHYTLAEVARRRREAPDPPADELLGFPVDRRLRRAIEGLDLSADLPPIPTTILTSTPDRDVEAVASRHTLVRHFVVPDAGDWSDEAKTQDQLMAEPLPRRLIGCLQEVE